MSETISISVPRDAVLLRLASDFYRQAAEHVEANPSPEVRVLHQRVGDVEATVAGTTENEETLINALEALTDPEYEQELIPAPEAVSTEPEPVNVAAAFAPKPSIFDDTPPVYEMTPEAGTFTREQYHESGWSDDALIEAGYMVKKGPAAPVAAAPTPSPAPMAPKPTTAITPVPTPAPPTSGATPSGVELDSEDLPWDGRINSGTKTKMKSDGTWKLKKGVDKAYVDQVKAELRQLRGNAPAAAAAAPTPKAPASPAAAVTVGAALMKRISAAMSAKQINHNQVLDAVRSPQVNLPAVADLCKPGNELLCATVEAMLFPEQ